MSSKKVEVNTTAIVNKASRRVIGQESYLVPINPELLVFTVTYTNKYTKKTWTEVTNLGGIIGQLKSANNNVAHVCVVTKVDNAIEVVTIKTDENTSYDDIQSVNSEVPIVETEECDSNDSESK